MSAFRIKRKIQKALFREQYSLLVTDTKTDKTYHLAPPRDRMWADPFPVERDGSLVIFIEQQITGKNGTLGYLTLDEASLEASRASGWVPAFTEILARPYHLSFPYLFAYSGHLYMIPESNEAGRIDCFRCVSFPDKWDFDTTLMDGVIAVDSAVWERDGSFYLLANIAMSGESLNQKACLFVADSFPTSDWRPCGANPVVDSLSASRNAGKVVERSGRLIRPAQDSSREYGGAMTLREIVECSERAFHERELCRIDPPRGYRACGTHTYNETARYIVTDIKTRTLRYLP